MESFGDVVEVLGVEASDGDTSIHGHVDVILLAQLVDLVLVETGEGEHADLAGDVAPVVLVSEGSQFLNKTMAHSVHTSRHISQVLVPHGGEIFVAENDVDDTGTVDGWVRIDRSGDLLYARQNNIFLFGTTSDNGDAASTLTVETEVLGERLEEHDVVSVLLEKLERVAISLKISTSETLISRVES